MYRHTQRGPIHWILGVSAAGATAFAWSEALAATERVVLLAVAGLFAILACAFARLTVENVGGELEIRFGPLPLFRRRLDYGEMRAVEPARSGLLDGLGIHWKPGRGWIWNIWGRDCVEITLRRGKFRVGSDDVDGLVAFLRGKLAARGR